MCTRGVALRCSRSMRSSASWVCAMAAKASTSMPMGKTPVTIVRPRATSLFSDWLAPSKLRRKGENCLHPRLFEIPQGHKTETNPSTTHALVPRQGHLVLGMRYVEKNQWDCDVR